MGVDTWSATLIMKDMNSAVIKVSAANNGFVQIETRDSVITVKAEVWERCKAEEANQLQAAYAAERSKGAMVVRF